jgi:hypothetical protein
LPELLQVRDLFDILTYGSHFVTGRKKLNMSVMPETMVVPPGIGDKPYKVG